MNLPERTPPIRAAQSRSIEYFQSVNKLMRPPDLFSGNAHAKGKHLFNLNCLPNIKVKQFLPPRQFAVLTLSFPWRQRKFAIYSTNMVILLILFNWAIIVLNCWSTVSITKVSEEKQWQKQPINKIHHSSFWKALNSFKIISVLIESCRNLD